ncbi:MAG: ATP-binding protein [Promethearchaeota archaeon]
MTFIGKGIKRKINYLIERYPPIGKLLSSLMSLVEVGSLEILNWISSHISPNFKIRIMSFFKGKWGSRVVPLNVNIPAETKYLPQQEIFEIISRSKLFAIGECYCRTKHQKETGCTHPTHTCILISPPQGKSLYDIANRKIVYKNVPKKEIIELLDDCDKRGLVHQLIYFPSPNYFYVICNCCTCCCEALSNYKQFLSPKVVKSDFIEDTDMTLCVGCGNCISICPFGARELENGKLIVNRDSCFGCGVCIRRCSENAIKLIKRKFKT